MKKLITFLIVFLLSIPAFAQSVRDTKVRIRDRADAGDMATVTAYVADLGTTVYGVVSLSAGYFYDATTAGLQVINGAVAAIAPTTMPTAPWNLGLNYFYDLDTTAPNIWSGRELDLDNLPVTTRAPYVGSFLHSYDDINNDWDRLTGIDVQLSAKDMFGLLVFAANGYYSNDAGWFEEWAGGQLDGDDVPSTQDAPYVGSFLHGWHSDDSLWERLRLTDHADGLATSLHGLVTASVMYGYNGATLDMLRVGASNELQVTDIATRPGEDAANDLRKVSKVDIGTHSPAKTTTTGIGATPTTVLASTQILGYPNVCVWLENDDGANPFTDADVFVSPNGTSWVDLSWVSCDSLAAGESCVYCISGNAYRYIKVEVTGAGGATVDVDAWLTGNKN